jgi:amino acid transporter
MMTWFGIGVTYTRFYAGLQAQGISRKSLPYASPLQPYAAWYAVVSTFVICFFSGVSVFINGSKC